VSGGDHCWFKYREEKACDKRHQCRIIIMIIIIIIWF
jgi:hypothetical protein